MLTTTLVRCVQEFLSILFFPNQSQKGWGANCQCNVLFLCTGFPISLSRNLHISPLCFVMFCEGYRMGVSNTQPFMGVVFDQNRGKFNNWNPYRGGAVEQKSVCCASRDREISIESRHPWLPLNVACEIRHVIPYGCYCDCSSVAQLRFLAPFASLTAGPQARKGPALRYYSTSARTASAVKSSMHSHYQAPLKPRGS